MVVLSSRGANPIHVLAPATRKGKDRPGIFWGRCGFAKSHGLFLSSSLHNTVRGALARLKRTSIVTNHRKSETIYREMKGHQSCKTSDKNWIGVTPDYIFV